MKKGDKIIWDSHFGYEVGYFSNEKGVMYNTSEVDLVSGIVHGKLSVTSYEILAFTKEIVESLNVKYNKTSDMYKYENLLERLNNISN